MESASYGALDHRYDLYGADSDVEEFMKHVKTSIINGDKEWISKHVDYPLETTLDGENPIKIKTKKQLVANFDKIFYQAYKDKIKSYCTCNLFSKDDGVMLGSGLIWINNSPKSNAIIYDFNIIGINNSVEDLKLH